MAEKKELEFQDFTDVTGYIHMALDKMDTIYKSLELSERQHAELARLGRLLHDASHDLGHFFLTLESLPGKTKEDLQQHYAH